MPWDEHIDTIHRELANSPLPIKQLFGLAVASRPLLAYRVGMRNAGDERAADMVESWLVRLWGSESTELVEQAKTVMGEVEAVIPGEDSDYTWQQEQDALITPHSYLRFIVQGASDKGFRRIISNGLEFVDSVLIDRISPEEVSSHPAMQDELSFQRSLAAELSSAPFSPELVARVRARVMSWSPEFPLLNDE